MAEAVPTPVTLSLWRVFGMAEVVPGRPPEWAVLEAAGPAVGDQVTLVLGAVPDDLIRSVVEWSAQGNARISMHVGHVASRSEAQALYEADLETADASVFDEPYPMALTLRLTREVSVTAALVQDIQWAEDVPSLLAEVAGFEKTGNAYLDAVVPFLIEPMWPMNFGRLLYSERRAFCTSPGRPAYLTPRFTLTVADWGVQVTREGGWAAIPTGALADSVAALPTGTRPGALTAGAAEFFLLAAAEEDPLRRFVFAFAGLEHLATQVASKRRDELKARLVALDAGIPAHELLWPDTQADRGLRFRMAAMIYLYSPGTAQADVAQANDLAEFRNKLFHGVTSDDVYRDRSIVCKELLRRYLGLVAAHEGTG